MGQVNVEYLLSASYMVFIGAVDGIESGMRISPDRKYLMYGNIGRQFIVDPEKKVLVFNTFTDAIEMRPKDPGMYPCICPSATGKLDLLTK